MKFLIFCLFSMMMALPVLAQPKPNHVIIVETIPPHVMKVDNVDAIDNRKDSALSFPVQGSILNTKDGSVETCYIEFPTTTENAEKIQVRPANARCIIEFESYHSTELAADFIKIHDLWTYSVSVPGFQQGTFVNYDPNANVWVFDQKNGTMHSCYLDETLQVNPQYVPIPNESACVVRVQEVINPEITSTSNEFFNITIEDFCRGDSLEVKEICDEIHKHMKDTRFYHIPDFPIQNLPQ